MAHTPVLDPLTPLYNRLVRERRYGTPHNDGQPIFDQALHATHADQAAAPAELAEPVDEAAETGERDTAGDADAPEQP